MWEEFSKDKGKLSKVAENIINGVHHLPEVESSNDDEEEEFPEGKVLYRIHKGRERKSSAVRKKKDKAIESGNLKCEICKFDFHETYGELG